MDIKEEFHKAFEKKLQKLLPFQTIIAKVTAIDLDNFTCDVKPVDDSPEYYNVRLQAIIDDNDQGVVFLPKIGSSVIVSIINNDENNNYICQYSEITEFIYKIDELEFSANTDGVRVINKNENLKIIIDDLIDNINNQNDKLQEVIQKLQKVIVIYGTSPDIPGLTVINTNLIQIHENNTTVKTRLNKVLKQ